MKNARVFWTSIEIPREIFTFMNLKAYIGKIILEELGKISRKHRGMKESLDFLIESRFDDAKKKYPNVSDQIDQLADIPSKYIFWVARELNTGLTTPEEIRELLKKYEQAVNSNRVSSKDINTYSSFKALEDELSHVTAQSNTQLRKKAKEDAEFFYNTKDYAILKPNSMEASCYYGKNTKWCISATESENWFNSYSEKGINFYFIISKKRPTDDPLSKVAFATSTRVSYVEIYDAFDTKLTKTTIEKNFPQEILDVLNKLNIGDFQTHEKRVENLRSKILAANSFAEHHKALADLFRKYDDSEERRDNFNSDLIDSEQKDIIALLLQVMEEVPLEKLGWFQDPFGKRGISWINVGMMDEVQKILTKRILTVDDFLKVATTMYSTYSREDLQYGSNILFSFLDQPHSEFVDSLTIEDLRKLSEFKDKNGVNQFKWSVIDLYLQRVAIDYDIEPESNVYKLLRNYINSPEAKEEVNKFMELVKAGRTDELANLWRMISRHTSIGYYDYMELAKLIINGMNPEKLMEPIIGYSRE